MNLILVSDLILDPPSDPLFVRYLTMISNQEMGLCNVIETEKENWDYIYKRLKSKYYWDFFYDFVEPDLAVEGIRIDTKLKYCKTIKTSYIKAENTVNIIGQVKMLTQL